MVHSLVQIVERRSLVISKSFVHASIIEPSAVTLSWFVSRVLGAKVSDLDATWETSGREATAETYSMLFCAALWFWVPIWSQMNVYTIVFSSV